MGALEAQTAGPRPPVDEDEASQAVRLTASPARGNYSDGVDLDLSVEQQDFQKSVRAFVDDRSGHMPSAGTAIMSSLGRRSSDGGPGVVGLPFPEEYGGSDAGFLTLCLAIEEIARVDSSLAITLEAAVGLGAMPIFRFGTTEQKEKWLPALAAGEALAGFGLTEPGAVRDAGSSLTSARLDGGQWVINGSKSFITNSGTPITSFVTITAITGQQDGHKETGRSWFRPEPRDSPWPRRTERWAGGIRTPTSCRSAIARCRKATSSASAERATATS